MRRNNLEIHHSITFHNSSYIVYLHVHFIINRLFNLIKIGQSQVGGSSKRTFSTKVLQFLEIFIWHNYNYLFEIRFLTIENLGEIKSAYYAVRKEKLKMISIKKKWPKKMSFAMARVVEKKYFKNHSSTFE